MTTSLREQWRALRPSDTPAGDGWTLRLAGASDWIRVYAGLRGTSKSTGLVIDIPAELVPLRLHGLSARRFEVTASEMAGLPPSRSAITVRLLDPAFEDLFSLLAEELKQRALDASNAADAVRGVVKAIERWRQFLERRGAPLGPEEVVGLIAELRVLHLLVRRCGPEAALQAWKAPGGAIRDFECPDRAIEVKAYSSSAGGLVHINDPLQLQPDAGLPLYLACVEVVRSPDASLALPHHVASVAREFSSSEHLSDAYRDAMAARGYLDSHAPLYEDGLAVGRIDAFAVEGSFPRIDPSDVPPGIRNLHYSLSVASLGDFARDADVVIGPAGPSAGA